MVFFLIATSTLIITYSYIGWRLIVPARIRLFPKTLLWIILILFMPMAPLYIFWRKHAISSPWVEIFSWLTYLSLGFFYLLFTFLIIRDMAFFLYAFLKRTFMLICKNFTSEVADERPPVPERRSFLIHSTNLGMLGISGVLSGYGLCNTRQPPNIVKVSVPVKSLPDDLEGFLIVQITDTHISPTISKDYMQTVVTRVNNLNADIIVITGDLADGPVAIFRNNVIILKDLCAQYGCYFVTGNHEYYAGAEPWIEEIDRLGIKVLLNENRLIRHCSGRIIVAGVTDYSAGRFLKDHVSDPKRALSGAQHSHVRILLAHQPRSIFAAASAEFDLQISGHTHGGQFYPGQFFVYLQQPYLAGLHRYDKTWIYVSRGTGYWGPPIRLGAPSEITVITLTKQERDVG